MIQIRAVTAVLLIASTHAVVAADRPNVLLVITDDQGYGDLGCHGNPILKTPHLDAFSRDSIQFTHFYVSPVCSPTRSSLLTGRYNYRTGVVDTFVGRSMMHSDEVTLAESLREGGYRTGLFGKWHLGDNYPLRPQDQGFQEVLMHRGGGIGQPSDPPGGGSYIDPLLFENGKAKSFTGYITDVITDAALKFVNASSDRPFFAYVAFNCPHSPYQVRDEDSKPYQEIDLGPESFPKLGAPWAPKASKLSDNGRAYGMIANLDANFGRLLARVPDNTIVIFMTDNGPGGPRWNAGLRNRKGTVYEGGIRVPFYVRWKEKLDRGRKIDTPAAHIDVYPTILEACGLTPPSGVSIDGRSLLPLMKDTSATWPDRHLFMQWHRGDLPESGRAFAVRGPRYKLVQAAGVQPGKFTPKLELFAIPNDPFEQKDLAADHPEIVRQLLDRYQEWFNEVKSTRSFAGPRIHIGNDRENPTVLTRQDWRGPNAGWGRDDLGHWDITVERGGRYRVRVHFDRSGDNQEVTLQMGGIKATKAVAGETAEAEFKDVRLSKGETRLETWVTGTGNRGANSVEVERVGD